MKQKIIVVTGPTACGKTGAAIELCKILDGEVISADSMQVYKHMDIGTAKVTEKESRGIPHYLIDELEPWEDYSAAEFKSRAKTYIGEISERGKLPVIVGGTGFYINALLKDNDFGESEKDYTVRNKLNAVLEEKGPVHIYNMLSETDPVYAAEVHPNNIKRVLRALEYCMETGERFSEHNRKERMKEDFYNSRVFVLNMDREALYDRINKRIDIMLEKGLVNEVNSLLEMGVKRDAISMQGLGYKEIIQYISGEASLEEAAYMLKRDTRHFAKRQLTWFKHQLKDAEWIDVDKFDDSKAVGGYIAERTREWLTE